MGTDISLYVEVRINNRWRQAPIEVKDLGLNNRSYGIFGFLGHVHRNYSKVPPITQMRGLPDDASLPLDDFIRYEYNSWITLQELLDFNYEQQFEDLRVTRQTSPNVWDGSITAEPGEGVITTFREFLGADFFMDLAVLKALGAPEDVRILYSFD